MTFGVGLFPHLSLKVGVLSGMAGLLWGGRLPQASILPSGSITTGSDVLRSLRQALEVATCTPKLHHAYRLAESHLPELAAPGAVILTA